MNIRFHPSSPSALKQRRAQAAFTMSELLVAACISTVLGLIVYGVASEAVIAFARNISINRSYSNARQTMDRIGSALQSAGNTPIQISAAGMDIAPVPAVGVAEPGIRFWRYSSTPCFEITTPALTDSALTLSLYKPGSSTVTMPPPGVGDIITVAALGFQAQATAVSATTTTAIVSFSGTVVSNTPATGPLTQTALTQAATAAGNNVDGKMSCLAWTSVAFIAINNQLRYYPRFAPNTASNITAPYKVLTYLTASLGSVPTPFPFALGATPTINVDLYAEAPDYNNRTTTAGTTNLFNGVSSANTYTYLQSALAPRNPIGLLRNP